jgi:hypothetical protein
MGSYLTSAGSPTPQRGGTSARAVAAAAPPTPRRSQQQGMLREERVAAAALAAALAEERAVTLTSACIDQLVQTPDGNIQRFHLQGGAASTTIEPHDMERSFGVRNLAPSQLTSMLLLTHTFAGLPDTLRVTTAVLCHGASRGAALLASAFGADAHVVLQREDADACVYTDVALGGESQDKSALGAMPQVHRAAVRSAQRMQLISAVAASIQLQWGDGYMALKDALMHAAPQLAPALDALTLCVSSQLAAGNASNALSHRAMVLRTAHAEELEARGEFIAAAACYKSVLSDDMRHPTLQLLDSPPLVWGFYGLALKRAGRFAEADAAYETGLRVLACCRITPDTPPVRETYRLDLLSKLVYLHLHRNAAASNAAVARLFGAQISELTAAGERSYSVACVNDELILTGHTTRRRFTVVFTEPPHESGQPAMLGRVLELRRDWQPAAQADAGSEEEEHLRMARLSLQRSGQPAKLPRLPRGCCAGCGEEATKRCGACGGPFYCGAACQRQDWKAHRAACKAASAK